MFRYKLRTLLIVLALGPPLLASALWGYGKWREELVRQRALAAERECRSQTIILMTGPNQDPTVLPRTVGEWEDSIGSAHPAYLGIDGALWPPGPATRSHNPLSALHVSKSR